MTHGKNEGDAETRKLDALLAIGKAVTELGSSFTLMVAHTLDNSRKLDGIDRKVDQLLDLARSADRPKKGK